MFVIIRELLPTFPPEPGAPKGSAAVATVLPNTWRLHPFRTTPSYQLCSAATGVKPWKVLQAPGLKPLADCQLLWLPSAPAPQELLSGARGCCLWVQSGSTGVLRRVRSRIPSSKAEAEPVGAENSHTDSLEFATALPAGGRGGNWPAGRCPWPLPLPHPVSARLMVCYVTVIWEVVGDLRVGTQLGASREVMCIMCWGSSHLPQPQCCMSWFEKFLVLGREVPFFPSL